MHLKSFIIVLLVLIMSFSLKIAQSKPIEGVEKNANDNKTESRMGINGQSVKEGAVIDGIKILNVTENENTFVMQLPGNSTVNATLQYRVNTEERD
jgi:hypothetical protein